MDFHNKSTIFSLDSLLNVELQKSVVFNGTTEINDGNSGCVLRSFSTIKIILTKCSDVLNTFLCSPEPLMSVLSQDSSQDMFYKPSRFKTDLGDVGGHLF